MTEPEVRVLPLTCFECHTPFEDGETIYEIAPHVHACAFCCLSYQVDLDTIPSRLFHPLSDQMCLYCSHFFHENEIIYELLPDKYVCEHCSFLLREHEKLNSKTYHSTNQENHNLIKVNPPVTQQEIMVQGRCSPDHALVKIYPPLTEQEMRHQILVQSEEIKDLKVTIEIQSEFIRLLQKQISHTPKISDGDDNFDLDVGKPKVEETQGSPISPSSSQKK